MKSINHVYEKIISEEIRSIALHNVCSHARHSRNFMKHYREYQENPKKTIEKSYNWITNYSNDKHSIIIINDGISRKQRKIIVPTFKELVVQHCIVEVLKPMFFKGMYRHSYASIPKRYVNTGRVKNGQPCIVEEVRGAHAGKKFIEKWIRDTKNVKYCLKMDIHHFFESISHDILKKKLSDHIHDEKFLNILYKIIDVTDVGIPIGFYTSQWLSNWYLQELDHYIKEQLHAKYYMRYMDDMIVFGSNKKKLHQIRMDVQKYLEEKLGLTLKDNWQVFRFVYTKKNKNGNKKEYGRDLDFMGFRFFRNRTIMRKSIMLKCTRKARRIYNKLKPTVYDARQMLSYNGYLRATDTYNMYLERIKPFINFKKLKKIISKNDKRRQKK